VHILTCAQSPQDDLPSLLAFRLVCVDAEVLIRLDRPTTTPSSSSWLMFGMCQPTGAKRVSIALMTVPSPHRDQNTRYWQDHATRNGTWCPRLLPLGPLQSRCTESTLAHSLHSRSPSAQQGRQRFCNWQFLAEDLLTVTVCICGHAYALRAECYQSSLTAQTPGKTSSASAQTSWPAC
jgi:hypothetical protein